MGACFDPRARAGRDSKRFCHCRPKSSFRSARPRGTRRRAMWAIGDDTMFRSARPRGTRRAAALNRTRVREVSIRAPARDATGYGRQSGLDDDVSIRAPARDATGWRWEINTSGSPFRSARPRGTRRPSTLPAPRPSVVSIRAPARDATRARRPQPGCGSCFDPRARAGRDSPVYLPSWPSSLFRSARPRGTRHVVQLLATLR